MVNNCSAFCNNCYLYFKRFFYSRKTYNVLNYVTLNVDDKELSDQLFTKRAEYFYLLFKPACFGIIGLFLFRTVWFLSS